MEDIAIKVDKVSKAFRLPHEKQASVKSLFVTMFHGKRTYERQQVLKDISFDIKSGEFFGIVGRNGSGKSTILKLLAGVYTPDSGYIQINGKLTPFIELGVGFNPELTGRENVYLNGALLGFNRKEMDAMYDEIVAFAELEKFMDQKLKNYSSGMQVRLAFSIAIRARSDILLLDEVLAVGDALFQKKCYDYFKQLKKDKKTVIFVSHDTNALLEYCDRCILLEKGEIVEQGRTEKVINEYMDILNASEEKQLEHARDGAKKRWGTGEASVANVQTYDPDSERQKSLFSDEDKMIGVKVTFQANTALEPPIYGITVMDAGGQRVFTSNTLWSKVKTSQLIEGQKVEVSWEFPNVFNTGSFSVSPAIADATGTITYDWLDDAHNFKVRKKTHSIAYINSDHKITIK
jgi:ABC-2 type transport system ATP-binding protein